MKTGPWQWLKTSRLGGLAAACTRPLDRLAALLEIPAPQRPQLISRITIMERDIVLPIKAVAIAMVLQSFYFTPWMSAVSEALAVAVDTARYFFSIYFLINLAGAALLLSRRWLPLALIEWTVVVICLVDGIFLGSLTMVTGGYNSILYYLFLALIVRGSVSVPRGTSQVMLNLTLCCCFVMAGVIDQQVADNLDETTRRFLDLPEPMASAAEPILLRVVLLLLMTACCYSVQVLLERQRRVVEETREFAVREAQLQTAGRLAAEFVHQIKNPLAIINSAAFSLRRALREGRTDPEEQIRIIAEEVERSDRIITQIMGYAQLSEGHVERLSVTAELDNALQRVFPPAAGYPMKIHKVYTGSFPPLFMQRRHAEDIFINLLQNAREALDGKEGNVFVSARCSEDSSIKVTIGDDGPGIPADKQVTIFEAYYTTKPKGTGLGLATVRNNVELYGGSVRVESELGKGARFILTFPARTLLTQSAR